MSSQAGQPRTTPADRYAWYSPIARRSPRDWHVRSAAATGSACHSGRTEPSAVLTAMGLEPQRALGAVRLSLGYDSTAAEIDAAAAALADAVVGDRRGGRREARV